MIQEVNGEEHLLVFLSLKLMAERNFTMVKQECLKKRALDSV